MSKWVDIERYLILFLKNEVERFGFRSVLFGLSGGLDSAVVAILCKKAFKDGTRAILMPSTYSSNSSIDDAKELCNLYEIDYEVVEIGDIADSYISKVIRDDSSEFFNLRAGNFCARVRMSILFDLSFKYSSLVVGTSNKSELMLGYGTIFGDLASALNPIGDIYKSELYEFAEHIGVTSAILKKAPSADLYEGQSDESELGYSYVTLDAVISAFVEERYTKDELIDRGYDKELVEFVYNRIFKNHYKRVMPIIAKLTSRTIGHDFLYPRDILT